MVYIEKNQNTPEQDDKDNWDQGWGLVLVYVLNICKALGSIPSTTRKREIADSVEQRQTELSSQNEHT